ncbi:RICIN domain-containing protein [Kitasatospora purpeofusca]|uniref:RICIN domain-containing protein n=1 Tax=Kitasatospora purpeofusca TaxID=67352 RepID=UPI0036D32E9B
MTDPAPTHRRRTRAALLALAAALATALPIAGTGTAHAGQTGAPIFFEVRNLATGKCLEVADWRTDDGAPVRQWTCTGGSNQIWTPNGQQLRNVHSAECLDIPGASRVWGTQVIQWPCSTSPWATNQQWSFPFPGRYSLPGYFSSLDLVLDVPGGDPSDGVPVVTWGANEGANQKWQFLPR